MEPYHKIQTLFKRDPATNYRTLLAGQYALPEFAYLAGNTWCFTEKVDGTNIRVIATNGKLEFRGKTDNAQIPPKLAAKLHEIFDPVQETLLKLDNFPIGVCLYGEGFGAGIQKGGGNYRDTPGFVLFDVRVGEWWLRRPDVEAVANKLGIEIVPLIGYGSLRVMEAIVRGGLRSHWGHFPAEGLVAKPDVELCSRDGNRIVTKLKAKDFD
jgi:ATP-dependent RNA circularization protein (DNA/RNA ligase family)